MTDDHRPNRLAGAPLEYSPQNELGVVFLFAHIARKLRLRIEKVQPSYPDCIAYRLVGDNEKKLRIEFEFKSSNFRSHKHDPAKCDAIVCWHHDWPEAPSKLEIIELKEFYGAERKIWIQPALQSQWHWLDEHDQIDWGLSKRAHPGDLLLMYRCSPSASISEIFVVTSAVKRRRAGWRDGFCYGAMIKRLCNLGSPIFLEDFRSHKVLSTAGFVRKNMQGNLHVTEYWPYLYKVIIGRNPSVKKKLVKYAPEAL